MKILIYGINYAPELTGIGKYTSEMTEWLAAQGHSCRVVTTPPYYPAWNVGKDYSSWRYKTEVVNNVHVTRCPVWVPKKVNAYKRILHLASYTLSSLPALFRNFFWKPDVVISIAPALFCAPQASLFAKLTGAKSWLHIQDYEIDAMLGLGMMASNKFLAKMILSFEKFVLRRFDVVSSISMKMCELSQKKGVDPASGVYFPNWVDTNFIKPDGNGRIFRDKWGINRETTVVLYSGNFGAKQGLEAVLESAVKLKHEDIQFILVGDGAQKLKLMKLAERLHLSNIQFQPLQPYEDLPDLLCMADIHLVVQKKGAADVVLPSKVTSIMAAGGHAIITADEDTELGKLVTENPGIATLVPSENVIDLIAAIKDLSLNKVGKNLIARNYALENLSIKSVLSNFEYELKKCVTQTLSPEDGLPSIDAPLNHDQNIGLPDTVTSILVASGQSAKIDDTSVEFDVNKPYSINVDADEQISDAVIYRTETHATNVAKISDELEAQDKTEKLSVKKHEKLKALQARRNAKIEPELN